MNESIEGCHLETHELVAVQLEISELGESGEHPQRDGCQLIAIQDQRLEINFPTPRMHLSLGWLFQDWIG